MKLSPLLASVSVLLGACSSAWAVPMAQREFELVMTRSPNLENGAYLYATCAACHGSKGEGVADGTVPALAGQSYTVIVKQIVDFRAGVRSDPRMEHFTNRRHLAFSQPIADVAQYIAKLPRPSAKVPPAGVSVERGAMVYARACERCHGASGEGKEDTLVPRLASQHYDYLIQQLNNAATGDRPSLVETHTGLLRTLSADEQKAVAAYLSSLEP